MNCGTIHASTCLVVGYCHKWQYPNNHPLCHLCRQLSSCFFSTSLHSASFPSLPFWERLQSNIPLRAYQSCSIRNDFSSLTPRLTTPPQTEYYQVRQSLSEYLNVITSSPLFQESTHPGVAPTLYSTLGTTLYFSVSLSLFVVRVQVALHLWSWGQPIKGWSISIFIIWVLQCHFRAHHLDKSQLVPGTCAYPLLLHSSRILMLHKSSTYCPRQMSSSSLIFSIGAISMKVNPAFVFILIIATSLAIHLSTHI
jgi:hypothetical protein